MVHVDSFGRWYLVFFQIYIRKKLFSNKIDSLEIVLHKMAAPESNRKRLYNTDEADFAILADDDSDNETFKKENVDEDSSFSQNNKNQVPAPTAAPVRGAPVRSIRTRGGVRISISQNERKEQQKRALEDKWKTEHYPPVIRNFTVNHGL